MSNPREIAQSFVTYFYQVFDSAPANLAGLYSNDSMLTFEGQEFLGAEQILGKINSTGATFVHKPETLDVQPLFDGSILVVVSGSLTIDTNNPLQYSESFILKNNGANSFYVANDVLRLI
ncbi:hypothetical protein WA158_001679, partial [Blastocystis sp. Blastoise]